MATASCQLLSTCLSELTIENMIGQMIVIVRKNIMVDSDCPRKWTAIGNMVNVGKLCKTSNTASVGLSVLPLISNTTRIQAKTVAKINATPRRKIETNKSEIANTKEMPETWEKTKKPKSGRRIRPNATKRWRYDLFTEK